MSVEIIGGVGVTITGNFSPMMESIIQAEAAANQAGAQIATAFNSSTPAVSTLEVAIRQLTATLGAMTAAASSAGAGQRRLASDIHGTVTEIQAVSGTLRTLDGNGGIRAAERFLTMIPGLGAAMQMAFPLIGIIALVEVIGRAIGKFTELSEAEKKAAEEAKELSKAYQGIKEDIAKIDLEKFTVVFGAGPGQAMKAAAATMAASSDVVKVGEKTFMLSQLRNAELEKTAVLTRAIAESSDPSQSIEHFIGDRGVFSVYKSAIREYKTAKQELTTATAEQVKLQRQADLESAKVIQAGSEVYDKQQKEAGSLEAKRLEDELAAFQALQDQKKQAAEEGVQLALLEAKARAESITSEYGRAVALGAAEVAAARDKASKVEAIAAKTADVQIAQYARIAAAKERGASSTESDQIQQGLGFQQGGALRTADSVNAQQDSAVNTSRAQAAISLTEVQRRGEQALNEEVAKGFESLDRGWKEAQARVSEYEAKVAEAANRATEIGQASAGEQAALKIQGQKIALEAQYAAQLKHTDAEHIAYLQQAAALDQKGRQEVIDGKEAQLATELAASNELRDVSRIASLRAEIAKLQGENTNASAKAQGGVATAQAQSSPLAQLNATLKLWDDTQQQKINAEQAVAEAFENVPQEIGNAIAQGLFRHQKGQSVPSAIGKDIVKALEGGAKSLAGELLTIGLKSAIGHIIPSLGKALSGASQIAAQATANAVKIVPPIVEAVDRAAARIASAVGGGGSQGESSACAECCQQTNQLLTKIAGSTASQTIELGLMATSLSVIAALQLAIFFKPSILGFSAASGTDYAPGGLALIGEKGPEIMHVPRGAQIIPNHKIGAYADGVGLSRVSSSQGAGGGDVHIYGGIHAHGITDSGKFMDHVARELPNRIKNRVPGRTAFAN